MTSEVINKSNIEVELKESNAGATRILSALKGNGDRFAIKLPANTTYREFVLGTKHAVGKEKDQGGSKFVISSDDCAEFETILIKNGDSEKLSLEYIKRGMSVTEVVNQTDRCFKLKHDDKLLEVLKKQGSMHSIQRDPKDNSVLDYVLVEDGGTRAKLSISIQDVADYQRINIVEKSGGVANLDKVRRGRYLMEMFNKTGTEFKVNRREGGRVPHLLAMLQKGKNFIIEYDPATKGCEYWVESSSPPQKLPITSEDFVNSQRMEIVKDSSSPGKAKLRSAESRPVQAIPKKSFLSNLFEALRL